MSRPTIDASSMMMMLVDQAVDRTRIRNAFLRQHGGGLAGEGVHREGDFGFLEVRDDPACGDGRLSRARVAGEFEGLPSSVLLEPVFEQLEGFVLLFGVFQNRLFEGACCQSHRMSPVAGGSLNRPSATASLVAALPCAKAPNEKPRRRRSIPDQSKVLSVFADQQVGTQRSDLLTRFRSPDMDAARAPLMRVWSRESLPRG
jgi:hypothetical protein